MEAQPLPHSSIAASPDHDHAVEVHGISFGTYEALVEARDRSGRRFPLISIFEGSLRLVSPSSKHEQAKRYLEQLLDTWAANEGIELIPYGGTTQELPERAAIEPDTSYQVGRSAVDDSPDFVVEVEHRNPLTRHSFDIYQALGIREVWWLEVAALELLDADPELRPLRAYVLGADGYVENATRTSELLPDLDLTRLTRAIACALDQGPSAGRALLLQGDNS